MAGGSAGSSTHLATSGRSACLLEPGPRPKRCAKIEADLTLTRPADKRGWSLTCSETPAHADLRARGVGLQGVCAAPCFVQPAVGVKVERPTGRTTLTPARTGANSGLPGSRAS